jgi:general secretion pathway protein A
MFLEYYGLREQPFGVTPDPRYLYFSATHREALASLFYGIETGCGFLTLVAPPGMGKTTLLFRLLERLRSSAQTVFLFQTQCGSREFFRYLLRDLGVDASDQNLARMHESLNSVLLSNARMGRRFVLVIDEAQNLEDSVLETVRLLSDFETPQAKLMQIVLAGQPQLAERLSHPSLLQLRQRISIVSRLHPFTRVEMMVYIDYRLHVAGYSGPPLFKYDAIAQIAAHSGGIPRIINNVCFNALTLGYAKRQKQIDASIVREVLADLDIAALSSHGMTPSLPAWDSSSGFDGLAPTDESTYQVFHAAVRTALTEGTEGREAEGLLESDSLPTTPAGESNPLAAVSQKGAPVQAVVEPPAGQKAASAEEIAAFVGSLLAPPAVEQAAPTQDSPQAPPNKARTQREKSPTSAAAFAEAPGSPVEPSRSEPKAPLSENKTPAPASFAPPSVSVATPAATNEDGLHKESGTESASPAIPVQKKDAGGWRQGFLAATWPWAARSTQQEPQNLRDAKAKRRALHGGATVVVALILIAGAFVLADRHGQSVRATSDAVSVLSAPAPEKSAASILTTSQSESSETANGTKSVPRDKSADEPVAGTKPPNGSARLGALQPAVAASSTGTPSEAPSAAPAAAKSASAPSKVSSVLEPASRRPNVDVGQISAPIMKAPATAASSEPSAVLAAQVNDLFGASLNDGLLANPGDNSGPAAPPPAAPSRGGQLQPPKLVSSPPPTYPSQARSQQVQGNVVIDALVDATGKVTAVKVISGPVVFQAAAMAALRGWMYEPARLNGEPIAIHTTVNIDFRLR